MKTKLEEAIALVETGEKARARELLTEVLQGDPANDMAWVWMAAVVDTIDLRKECLEEALKHNPRNKIAQRALQKLQARDRVTDSRTENRSRQLHSAVIGLSVLLFLLGLIMAFVNWSRYQQDVAFQTEGQAIQARITRLYRVTGRGSGDYAEYAYTVGGSRYTDESRIPYQDWKAMRVGGTIKIRYLPSNPDVTRYYNENRDAPEKDLKRGWMVVGLLLVSPVVLVGTLVAAQTYVRKQNRDVPAA